MQHVLCSQSLAQKRKRAVRLALFFLLFVGGFTTNKSFAQYRFEHFTTSNGLPQSTVSAITQSRDGYLWFATYDGLVRYDGVRFAIFDKGNAKGISSNRFLTLCEDGQGALWIGTVDGGLIRYRNHNFTSFTKAQGLPDNNVSRIQCTQDGLPIIFFGATRLHWSADNALASTNIFLWSKQDSLISVEPQSLIQYVDRSGARWQLEPDKLLRITGDRQTAFPIGLTPEEFLQFHYEDRAGNMWFGTKRNELYVVTGDTLKSYAQVDGLPEASPIKVGGEDREGNLWLFSKRRVVQFKDGQFIFYTEKDGLASQDIRAVYCDREGTIWVGTNDNGLYRLSRQFLATYSKQQGLLNNIIYPIYQDRSGNIWIGSAFGLNRFANGQLTSYPLALPETGKQVEALVVAPTDTRPRLVARCFLEDNEGGLWVGTDHGLLRMKDGKFTIQFQITSSYVSAMIQDRTGGMWFGTGNGLVKYQAGAVTSYTVKDGLPDDRVDALYQESQGDLWVGTRSGLARLEGDRFTTFTDVVGLADSAIRSIYQDLDGNVWIGTFDSGLSRFKEGRFTNYTTQKGLFNNGVFQILEDRRGNFWISCNRGIYRVSRQQLNAYADGKISAISCVAYGSQDGMLSAECNGGRQPGGIKAQDGKLWFPTQGGVVVIDPELVPYNEQPPLPTIESIVIDQTVVNFQDGIEIEPFQNDLEINYTAPSSIKAEHIHFKYKLIGLSDDWIDAGTRRSVHYSHLPPGRYTFQLIAANSDGVWNETGILLKVNMKPFFYQTRLFLALCAISLIALGLTIYVLRVRRLKATERSLTRLVSKRTRELVERTQQLESANERLEQLATLDGLTNIANHRRFKEFLNQEWLRSQREFQPLAVLLMDVDYFKLYNDNYGHQGGDECLKQVAQVLRDSVQRATDLAARYGGEEFVVVLTNTDKEGAFLVAERIRRRLEALHIPHSGSKVSAYVTVSIGLAAMIPDQQTNEDDLIADADKALYRAKENGRNCCWVEAEAMV